MNLYLQKTDRLLLWMRGMQSTDCKVVQENFLGMINMFNILIMVIFVRIHWRVDFMSVYFSMCKLYFNKIDLFKNVNLSSNNYSWKIF